MKVYHIADLHIRNGFTCGVMRNGFDSRLFDLRKLLMSVAFDAAKYKKKSKGEQVVLIVSGDVFNSPDPDTISRCVFDEFLFFCLENFIYIVMIPGNHEVEGAYTSLDNYASMNLNPLMVSTCKSKCFDVWEKGRIGVVPWQEDIGKMIDGIKKVKRGGAAILVTHGIVEGFAPNNWEERNELDGRIPVKLLRDFEYCALGHLHCNHFSKNIGYPGGIIREGFHEGNVEKGVIELTFKGGKLTHKVCKIFTDKLFAIYTFSKSGWKKYNADLSSGCINFVRFNIPSSLIRYKQKLIDKVRRDGIDYVEACRLNGPISQGGEGRKIEKANVVKGKGLKEFMEECIVSEISRKGFKMADEIKSVCCKALDKVSIE